MKKLIAASLASVAIAASMMQIATAGERTPKHHHAAAASEQVRDAHAWVAPSSGYTQDDLARLQNGVESAPASR
jgi:hypothetical protein